MIVMRIGQLAADHGSQLGRAVASVAADPKTINTDAILSFLVTKIAPLLLGVLGIIFIGRAGKGEVSKVLTSSAIAIIGLVFLAGAASLFFLGDSLVQIAFK